MPDVQVIAQLSDSWRNAVYGQMLCRDIDMLDQHAPAALRRLWNELEPGPGEGLPDGATATIYHLGLSELRAEYVGYVYRSTADFESESMEPGFRVKPQPVGDLGDSPETLEAMVALAHRLRDEQATQPSGERVYIGGELNLVVLHERSVFSVKVHRYEDFEEIWQRMNDRLAS